MLGSQLPGEGHFPIHNNQIKGPHQGPQPKPVVANPEPKADQVPLNPQQVAPKVPQQARPADTRQDTFSQNQSSRGTESSLKNGDAVLTSSAIQRSDQNPYNDIEKKLRLIERYVKNDKSYSIPGNEHATLGQATVGYLRNKLKANGGKLNEEDLSLLNDYYQRAQENKISSQGEGKAKTPSQMVEHGTESIRLAGSLRGDNPDQNRDFDNALALSPLTDPGLRADLARVRNLNQTERTAPPVYENAKSKAPNPNQRAVVYIVTALNGSSPWDLQALPRFAS